MERKEVMGKNVAIYRDQASALAKFAAKDVKILVVANPANTNALILSENAPSIPKENITCLTRLDHNRALGQVISDLPNIMYFVVVFLMILLSMCFMFVFSGCGHDSSARCE